MNFIDKSTLYLIFTERGTILLLLLEHSNMVVMKVTYADFFTRRSTLLCCTISQQNLGSYEVLMPLARESCTRNMYKKKEGGEEYFLEQLLI